MWRRMRAARGVSDLESRRRWRRRRRRDRRRQPGQQRAALIARDSTWRWADRRRRQCRRRRRRARQLVQLDVARETYWKLTDARSPPHTGSTAAGSGWPRWGQSLWSHCRQLRQVVLWNCYVAASCWRHREPTFSALSRDSHAVPSWRWHWCRGTSGTPVRCDVIDARDVPAVSTNYRSTIAW